MPEPNSAANDIGHLEKVERELARYEHPLFDWSARQITPGVEVTITLKVEGVYDQPYRLCFKPREIEARGFQWDFQRQLYNCLHDYLVEMFTRSPHIAEV
ncbi:MAG TPA: hypothetical protein VLM38_24445 [Blastocatellia bacterium]|nr:hypothetical protein [Blastocatellia bacterium]